jgi:antitoxin component YwqK of YwqJK toxin-antitoxin module
MLLLILLPQIMKKTMLLLAVVLFAQFTFAQKEKKNEYVANGETIEATLYHDNGMIAQTGFYTNANALDGEWISYDAQGNKTAVANYDNGIKVGTWMFYQGETIKEVSYNNSDIAEVKTWKVTDTRVVSNRP